jgi:phosphoenolpyruvate-protein kinase (PTS system EI component)
MIRGRCLAAGKGHGVAVRSDGQGLAPGSILITKDLSAIGEATLASLGGIIVEYAGPTEHIALKAAIAGTPVIMLGHRFPESLALLDKAVTLVSTPEMAVVGLELGDLDAPRADPIRRPMYGDIQLRASISDAEGAREARKIGAASIGMWRTENFLIPLARQYGGFIDYNLRIASDTQEVIAFALGEEFMQIWSEFPTEPVVVRIPDMDLSALSTGWSPSGWALETDLGIRGCRLGILVEDFLDSVFRGLYQGVARASQHGNVDLWLLLPMIADLAELDWYSRRFDKLAHCTALSCGGRVKIVWGANIETPRSALVAGRLAPRCGFLSVGTNDLTQYCWALSRGASGARLLEEYHIKGIGCGDPFMDYDSIGTGRLVELAIAESRAVNPSVQVGISGEMGGNPEFVEACRRWGVDYISLSSARLRLLRE